MALSEFVAMESAYVALQQLDPAARQRALQWLTDALGVAGMLPQAPDRATTATAPTPGDGVATAPSTGRRAGRRARAASPAPAAEATSSNSRRTPKAGRGERAYRRMPDAAEVLAAYQQAGSVSALADYFGVPRHTVQGWARRLRREGYDIGRSA